jgi:hypothetical protein
MMELKLSYETSVDLEKSDTAVSPRGFFLAVLIGDKINCIDYGFLGSDASVALINFR